MRHTLNFSLLHSESSLPALSIALNSSRSHSGKREVYRG